MRMLLYFAAIATCFGQVSVDPIRVPPENRMALSKFSDHILLVEITSVERKPPKRSEGLEHRLLVVKGKILEVVRGDKGQKKEIEYSDNDISVFDRKALRRSSIGDTDMFDGPPDSKETGSGECEVGERYVMLFALGKAYFVHLRAGDESWRSKIKKFEFKL